jgi:hypothetical protein
MNPKTIKYLFSYFVIMALLSGVFSCNMPPQATTTALPLNPPVEQTPSLPAIDTPIPINPPTVISIPTLTATSIPIPMISLKKGDFYFSIDGRQSFLYSRNVAGSETSNYDQLLDWTSAGGSKFVRIHLDSFGMGYIKTGIMDESWAMKWESVFDKAASDGVNVIPVFGVWYDWNIKDDLFWKNNPLNEKNGGPAKTPVELLISDSPTQKIWYQWMKTVVERWQGRENILAWEIFSEVNLVSGATESQGISFVNNAASIIRNADSFHRPVSASLAENSGWTNFYSSDGIDFTNFHPYPLSGDLDAAIITGANSMLAAYQKPVMIGESGLSFELPDRNPPTLTTADRADIGIKHAIWAAVVSGAMNGRSLWWEDGVAIYFPSVGWTFLNKYSDIELPAAKFVSDVDFSGFKPMTTQSSGPVFGAVIGNEKMAIGWYRDAGCKPPLWSLQPVISNQTVTIALPGSTPAWRVDFYNTKTGMDIVGSETVTRKGNSITITLPDFSDDIAFKLYSQG